jgi:sugar transferase (PEP-CTERM/EpsH1 system associated)
LNILYAVQRVPYPPNRGDKLAAYHAIRYLAQRHSVTVATLADSRQELEHARVLESQGFEVEVVLRRPLAARARTVKALISGEPLSIAHYYSPELARRVVRRAQKSAYDVAVAFSSSMGQYVPETLGIPLIADFVDMDSRKWDLYAAASRWPRSWIYAAEARRLLEYERSLARRAHCTLVRTEVERQDCVRLMLGTRVEVLRNGVDLRYFMPDGIAGSAQQIVFTGMMDYFPNVQAVTYFCEEIFPLVRKAVPAATFVIVGARPTRRVRALRHRQGVTVTGQVADVRPYLRRSIVAVAPLLLARGVQNKVLEAMATGLPVVATPAAFQGTGATEGDGILVGQCPADFAALVVRLIRDPMAASMLGRRGRAFVERDCVWETQLSRLESFLTEAAEARTGWRAGEPAGRGR